MDRIGFLILLVHLILVIHVSRKCSFVFSLSSIFINVVFALFPHLTTLNVVNLKRVLQDFYT